MKIKTLFVLMSMSISIPSLAEDIVGRASVIDGDTLEIRGTRIRMAGIDAPETSQTCGLNGKKYRCGQQAAMALHDKIGTRNVKCVTSGMDRYGRTIAGCYVDKENLSEWMVIQGFAQAYRGRYSKGYEPLEAEAHANRKGFWQGEFMNPGDYRHGKVGSKEFKYQPKDGECVTGPRGGKYQMIDGKKKYGC